MDASSPVSPTTSPPLRTNDRHLVVDGLANARDLGGVPLGPGGTTPRGVFFRSENLDQATDTGWQQLHAAGIRTVVDLRQPGERAHDTRPRPDWLTTVAVDLDGLKNTTFWADYWANGLVGTALYFLPHLAAMPERSGAVLSALAGLDLPAVLAAAGLADIELAALRDWRQRLTG